MNSNVYRTMAFLALLLSMNMSWADAAEKNWYMKMDISALAGSSSGSVERDGLTSFSLFLAADYLERGGLVAGYNRTSISFRNSGGDIDQDQLYLSGRYSLTPDWAAGRISLRLDGYAIDNNDPGEGTGDLRIAAPQISYMNFKKTFYVDIGYATSSYGTSSNVAGDLDVTQWTPTVGFGFNESRDWVQLRTFLIDLSNAERAQGEDSTAALEIKWTHWFDGAGLLGMDNIRLSGLVGERLYAVDPDAAVVYNLADIQTGGFTLGGEWALNERSSILLQFGLEQYEDRTIDDSYNNGYVYLNFGHQFK